MTTARSIGDDPRMVLARACTRLSRELTRAATNDDPAAGLAETWSHVLQRALEAGLQPPPGEPQLPDLTWTSRRPMDPEEASWGHGGGPAHTIHEAESGGLSFVVYESRLPPHKWTAVVIPLEGGPIESARSGTAATVDVARGQVRVAGWLLLQKALHTLMGA